jgi:hypothetical protein
LVAAILGNRHRGDDGLGFGGGLGGILIGALLGGGLGGFGRRDGERVGFGGECASKSDILMNKLGDIQAAIPLAESQTQLAIAGSTASINTQNQAQTLKILDGFTALNTQNQAQTIAMLTGFNNISREICEAGKSINATTVSESEKTRCLITSINDANLNRALTDARAEIIELRNEGRVQRRSHETEQNITQTVITNQQQQQQQQINDARFREIHDRLAILVADNQIAKATNYAVNFGGLQSASPVNTATNNSVR